MINITVICIGRLKEKYLTDACDEYLKRMNGLCKMNVVELNASPLSTNPNDSEIKAALSSEAKSIIAKIPKNSRVWTLCIEGTQKSSEQLAQMIETAAVDGNGNITFIIGGSFGLSDEVKALSQQRLSMSKMTFPHQLARVMLLEQIYRALQINAGTKYHK